VTIGFHSPLPPAPTGVASYAAALAAKLREFAPVRLNPTSPCTAELYHLGNNQLHRHIYQRALERPGVVVLHDAVLHHFFLGAFPATDYIEEFVYNYGEWSRELARELWAGRSRSAQAEPYFRYPMLRRIAETARAVVVHNPAAAAMVRAHAPGACVIEIPHLFAPPTLPDAAEVTRLRARLGIRPSATLFGVLGYLRESKRLPSILRAFSRLLRTDPRVRLLVAGQFVSPELERSLAAPLAAPGVIRTGYLPEPDWWLYASAVDVCINLRYPAAGESSGIAIRMMGIGKAVLVTAGAATARFPEAACVRVEAGPAEEEMLAEYMFWLARFPEARRELGRRAQACIAAAHDARRCARLYWETLCESPRFRELPYRSEGD